MGSVDIRDGICAYLQGGLGNQLFILAAGWEQATRLKCPLYIDGSRFLGADPLEFAKETPRHIDLAAMTLPGVVLGKDSPWFKNSPRRPRLIRRPDRPSGRLTVYKQPGFGFDEKINNIGVGTTIVGYFQSPQYFASVADQMHDMLWNASTTPAEEAEVNRIRADPRVTVHMRRGDYLGAAARAHHGVASSEYFARALDLCQRLVPGQQARVFSDSPVAAREELGTRSGLEFFAGGDSLGTVATLRAMAMGRGFVMSNSSFSWWAAWLMSRRGEDTVIAPRPWNVSGESASDLLLAEWMTLDAR